MKKDDDMVIFFRDWYAVAQDIQDDGLCLRYLRAILAYAFDGTEPDDAMLKILTKQARIQVDRQRAHFAEKSANMSAAAKRRGHNSDNSDNCDNSDKSRDKEKEKEKYKEKYKEKTIPDGIVKEKAQQAAPCTHGESVESSSVDTLPEEEKGCAEKEEVPTVEVEVVTARTRPRQMPPRFVPPTVAEVAEYCKKRGNGIDPEHFIAAYQQSGWKLKGGAPMRDWKAAIINWEKYRKNNNNGKSGYDNDKSVRDAEFARYWAGRVTD